MQYESTEPHVHVFAFGLVTTRHTTYVVVRPAIPAGRSAAYSHQSTIHVGKCRIEAARFEEHGGNVGIEGIVELDIKRILILTAHI